MVSPTSLTVPPGGPGDLHRRSIGRALGGRDGCHQRTRRHGFDAGPVGGEPDVRDFGLGDPSADHGERRRGCGAGQRSRLPHTASGGGYDSATADVEVTVTERDGSDSGPLPEGFPSVAIWTDKLGLAVDEQVRLFWDINPRGDQRDYNRLPVSGEH